MYHYAANNPVRYTDPDGRETKKYTLSENGIKFLKLAEGSKKDPKTGLLTVYNDKNGNATKGYGILLHYGSYTEEDKKNNPDQTEAQAHAEFLVKKVEYENIVTNRANGITNDKGEYENNEYSLTQKQADALISLCFNSPKVEKLVMKAIRAGKSKEEVKKIWLDGNSETSALGKRRLNEWRMYYEGTYAEDPYK